MLANRKKEKYASVTSKTCLPNFNIMYLYKERSSLKWINKHMEVKFCLSLGCKISFDKSFLVLITEKKGLLIIFPS